ncbi:SMU1112c/YaeR family gloxylase I-like metalloprotein [Tautonia sociabilis]|uniref:VOC domain-containing protein n=1 Tax=Tautonia sociabilis TaxID=2080755 RepID=A0A432MH61_9BACT|nr:hypothetical protein TsocGM_16280 [Tautonia sociabilis]
MLRLLSVHHVALIRSDDVPSRRFYVETIGLEIVSETVRQARDSHKLDLRLPDGTQLELVSFPDPPPRPSDPEARGLRHLAFEVDDLDRVVTTLPSRGVSVEPIRLEELTGTRFTVLADPDGLPLELYER